VIAGEFNITIKVPLGDREEISVKGEFTVNSREELVDYIEQAIDALQEEGYRKVEELRDIPGV